MALAEDSAWSKEQLMGGPMEESAPSKNRKGRGVDTNPMLWGVPGHLTADEVECYERFRAELAKRGGDFRDTVYCFGEEEGEVWCLTRWCRARKFVYDDIIVMVEEATACRQDAKSLQFYPNPIDALGVDKGLFFAQYPQLYYGVAKNGAPVFISKPGVLNVDALECITCIDGILKFHWYVMMHDFAERLRAQKAKKPDFKKFECFCILDLNKLVLAQLSKRTLAIIKEQAAIDSICFPETMNKMIIINAPTFFSATWSIIKGWIDARTAAKIEVISSAKRSKERLLELVDADQLPSDYGGLATDTQLTLDASFEGAGDRLESKMLYLRGHGSEICDIGANEQVEVTVYTRSTSGAKFQLCDSTSKAFLSDIVEVKHLGSVEDTAPPTCVRITTNNKVVGPVKLKVKADSAAGRFSTHNYLIVFEFFKK